MERRRPEIRPHGAFAYQGDVPLRRDSGGADRPRRAAVARVYAS